jgi:hypothetical protein
MTHLPREDDDGSSSTSRSIVDQPIDRLTTLSNQFGFGKWATTVAEMESPGW